jgi:hypothetical protein
MRARHGSRMLLSSIAVLLALVGCTPIYWRRVTINQPLHAGDIAVVPGQTTWQEVTAHLGMPSALTPVPGGFVATYLYYDAADFNVDFGWPLGFIGPVSRLPHEMAVGNTAIGADKLQIMVDATFRVRFAAFVTNKNEGRFKMLPTND